jgi:hypothetical protein
MLPRIVSSILTIIFLVKVCFLTASEKYCEDLRVGEYQTLRRDMLIQKPLSIKNLIKEINKRID